MTRPEFTERQAKAWPEAIAEAQQYVTSGTISDDPDNYYWLVNWQDETRPGRGHHFNGTWIDGEYLVQIIMDVYGYPLVSVCEVTLLHNSESDECDCEPCIEERAEDGQP